MRKIITLFFVSLLIFCIFACNQSEQTGNNTGSSTVSTTVTDPEAPHVHSFGSWLTLKDADCERAGSRKRSCLCGYSESESIPAKGHKWSKNDCTSPSVCTVCSAQGEGALGHDLENGFCLRCHHSFRTEEDIGRIINVVNSSVCHINSAGGVSVDIGWENKSTKKVNYIYFTVEAYNAVGDVISCSIRNHTKTKLTLTGPFEPEADNYSVTNGGMYGSSDQVWDNVWYNAEAQTVVIKQIEIAYEDQSTVVLGEADCALAMGEMTLSETVKSFEYKSAMELTLQQGKGELPLSVGIVSDLGYYIRKYGSVDLKITQLNMGAISGPSVDWIKGDVLYEHSFELTEENYITDHSNELTVVPELDTDKSGLVVVELEFSFLFEGESEKQVFTAMAYIRIT